MIYRFAMKVRASLDVLRPVDDEFVVGGLVRSVNDPRSTGMVVEFVSSDEVVVLWSVVPRPRDSQRSTPREIW